MRGRWTDGDSGARSSKMGPPFVRTGVTRLTSGFAPCLRTRRHSSNRKLEEAAQMTRGMALVRGGSKATGNVQNRTSATRCAGR